MRGIIPTFFACKHLPTVLAAAMVCMACSSTPSSAPPTADQSVLQGWRHCTDDNCGRGLASSTFVFLRVDDSQQDYLTSSVTVTPGRHWVEAHYYWGGGFIFIGIGNYRNYGFEIDLLPGHTYLIEDVPAGCIVPAYRYWVSPKTLRVIDLDPSGKRDVLEIKAMEYCTPSSSEPGTCKQNSDCRSGICTPFGGTTGYGLCGELR